MNLLHFVLIVSSVVVGGGVGVDGAYDNQVCRVERRSNVRLAEYKDGALNLGADYDTSSIEECFQRCCVYNDAAGNRCNAVSYYDVDGEYAICLLVSCASLDSCVWMQATNFTAALVLQDIFETDAANMSSTAWNQSTVTSQESTSTSTPSDLQDWNVVNNEEFPSQMEVPVPNSDSAAASDGTSLSSNGTLSEGQGSVFQDAWDGTGLDPGKANFTSDVFADNELTDNRTIFDINNDWNVIDAGVLSDNEQPTNSIIDNGQQQQQQQQPVVDPFVEGPNDDWNDVFQEDDRDFWSIFEEEDEEDDQLQSNKTVTGTEADQNKNDLEQPFNLPEQPFNQPEQPFNQPEQPFNQPEQPFDQPEQPFNQPEEPFMQPEQPFNQPEQPQQAFDDVRVTEGTGDDWQMGNKETPPHQDNTEPLISRIPIPTLGIIIGLCSAFGVAFLVLIAVCRKVYQGQEWPKYKPLRSDYDMRTSSSSSALLP